MKIKTYKFIVLILAFAFIFTSCKNSTVKLYSTIAQPLNSKMMEEKGYSRSESNNNENVLSYIGADDTKTFYVFSAPIENSLNNIASFNDKYYCSKGSYFGKYIPKELSKDKGITINKDKLLMTIIPEDNNSYKGESTTNINAFSQELPCVEYKGMFGNDTNYDCYATSFGVNTEIVLNKYHQTNTFRIKVQLPENLVPDTSSPDYIILKTALNGGEVKELIYTPLVVDAKGKWSYANSVKFTDKDSKTNTYTVEYTVDKEFLESPDTCYPVKINQSIHQYKSKQPDTSAYSKTGNDARHYLSPYMLLGDNTIKGEGWTFIRYETLTNLNLDPDKIESVRYNFCNLFNLQNEAVISAYAVTADWCSINTMWFSRPTFDENKVSSVTIKKAGVYQLDITPLAKEMIRNIKYKNTKYSVNNSFFIKSETTNSNMIFPSGDNGLLSPYLEIKMKH